MNRKAYPAAEKLDDVLAERTVQKNSGKGYGNTCHLYF